MSDLRVGRYRVVRRIADEPLQRRDAGGPQPRPGERRLIADAERQGDAAKRRLYVIDLADGDSRQLLADALVACVALQHENVLAPLDAGIFGERVYAAMAPEGGVPLARLLAAIGRAPAEDRALIVAAIGVDTALGLQAGHDLAGRGLVHDALDLESIVIDAEGRARVDGVFLDPWIASETIARSAAPFVAPERWKAPAGLATDVYALAAILDRVFGGPGPHPPIPLEPVVRARARAPAQRPRSAEDFATAITAIADVAQGRSALAKVVASLGSPSARPRGRPVVARDGDAPPRTKRMGSLETRLDADDAVEDEATIVERSPFFDDEKPAARDEATPLSLELATVAGTLHGELDDDRDPEVDGSTVVAPGWSAAMAKADAAQDDTAKRMGAGGPRPGEPMSPRQSSPAAGWEIKTGSRALGHRSNRPQQGSTPPLGAIPKATPFPAEPANQKDRTDTKGGAVPILWTEDSSADSDAHTRALHPLHNNLSSAPPSPLAEGPRLTAEKPGLDLATDDPYPARRKGPWVVIGILVAVLVAALSAAFVLTR